MKFRFISPQFNVNGYNGTVVSFGDVVDLDEWFSQKALANPDYEVLNDGDDKPDQGQGTEKVRRPRGRPKRNG